LTGFTVMIRFELFATIISVTWIAEHEEDDDEVEDLLSKSDEKPEKVKDISSKSEEKSGKDKDSAVVTL
jgi:hypothetical protein